MVRMFEVTRATLHAIIRVRAETILTMLTIVTTDLIAHRRQTSEGRRHVREPR